jgi:hypothetical protein
VNAQNTSGCVANCVQAGRRAVLLAWSMGWWARSFCSPCFFGVWRTARATKPRIHPSVGVANDPSESKCIYFTIILHLYTIQCGVIFSEVRWSDFKFHCMAFPDMSLVIRYAPCHPVQDKSKGLSKETVVNSYLDPKHQQNALKDHKRVHWPKWRVRLTFKNVQSSCSTRQASLERWDSPIQAGQCSANIRPKGADRWTKWGTER